MALTWKPAWEPPWNRAWNLTTDGLPAGRVGGAERVRRLWSYKVELPPPAGAAQHGRHARVQQLMNFSFVLHSPFKHSIYRAA